LGGSIGYWQGNPKTLLDDVGALKPTIFVGVPRIFDRIYTGVTQKVHCLVMLCLHRRQLCSVCRYALRTSACSPSSVLAARHSSRLFMFALRMVTSSYRTQHDAPQRIQLRLQPAETLLHACRWPGHPLCSVRSSRRASRSKSFS
jgi:hypothetical protein